MKLLLQGDTALICAARAGKLELAEVFIEADADINARVYQVSVAVVL